MRQDSLVHEKMLKKISEYPEQYEKKPPKTSRKVSPRYKKTEKRYLAQKESTIRRINPYGLN